MKVGARGARPPRAGRRFVGWLVVLVGFLTIAPASAIPAADVARGASPARPTRGVAGAPLPAPPTLVVAGAESPGTVTLDGAGVASPEWRSLGGARGEFAERLTLGAGAALLGPVTRGVAGAAVPTPPARVATVAGVDISPKATGPLDGIVIAIDPGHNGGNASHPATIRRKVFIGNGWKACNTVGTSTNAGYAEHRFSFAVARRVKVRLEGLGATVRMTRTTDTGVGPCVDARGRFGASIGARLMLSIHGDGSAAAHHGFVVMRPGLVRGYTDDILAASARLATAIRGGLLARGLTVANYYGRHGLVTRTDLGTLNLSDVPVVMVELGNMRNRSDAARMTSAAGRDRYAAGLVTGIRRFLGR